LVKVKICGITNIEDALFAVESGADALGFVFAESPRQVNADMVSKIIQELPLFVTTIGVFANQPADEVVSIMESTCLHFAQIHGDFGDKSVLGKGLGCRRIIRGLRVESESDLHDAEHDCPNCGCAALLLDSHVDGIMGGTGRTFDWQLAVRAHTLGKPIILAGGLTPQNVKEAVEKVHPYAVDVSTGVEASPGKKDRAKIEEFIKNAKSI